ncbi:MAG TPA: DUF885 domain-containing protein [Ginsengibacter sp.]|nr:DUF885 domain-containing protein [Ginsengibacter sp.]
MKSKPILFVYALVLSVFFITGCHQNRSKDNVTDTDSSVNKKLENLFNNYWEGYLKLFPFRATRLGDNRYNDQFPNDQTQSFRDTLKTFYQSYLDSAKTFDRSKLTDENKTNYDIFVYEMNTQLDGLKLNTWMIPFYQINGMPTLLPLGNTMFPFKTVKDYDNWLSRLNKFPAWADSAIGNFRQGMTAGVVLPKALVIKMIPQMQSFVISDPTTSLFYQPVTHLPKDFSAADSQRLVNDYKQVVLNVIIPTYKKLGDFLKNEYLPKSRTTSGLSAISGGDKMYAYDVKYWTTTDETPEQFYQTGLEQVAVITHEMDSVKNATGFKGDLKAFFHFINTDKKFFPFKTPQQVLDSFETIHKIVDAHVNKLFDITPKTPFAIRQVEKFREKSEGVPQYFPGAPDGSRPGVFYVPIPDAAKFNAAPMESFFLHEAIPGHHYQLSLQQEDTSLPKFRRFGGNGTYVEGYAFYCESLGKDLGLYTDPYQFFASLTWQMHRAIRLMVDAGIHAKGMTREQAIKYMMDHEAVTEPVATAEIERYMAMPGQALTYMTGRLKILQLRNKYEKELGNKFSIIKFHHELLSGGSMPLQILEKRMNEWAEKIKSGK